jgi:hypothetical protein
MGQRKLLWQREQPGSEPAKPCQRKPARCRAWQKNSLIYSQAQTGPGKPQPAKSRRRAWESSAYQNSNTLGLAQPSHSQAARHCAQQSQASANQPDAGLASTSLSEPSASLSEPNSSHSEPSTSFSEPSTSFSEPSTSLREPGTSLSEPSASLSEPSTSLREPSTSLSGTLPGQAPLLAEGK